MPDSTVTLAMDGGVARVTLARPDVRNAFNADVIRELHAIFTRLSGDGAVRAVVLAGEGKVFCGGADINWMRASLELSFDQNVADAERMSDMYRAIDRCSKPVIARIHGAALNQNLPQELGSIYHELCRGTEPRHSCLWRRRLLRV